MHLRMQRDHFHHWRAQDAHCRCDALIHVQRMGIRVESLPSSRVIRINGKIVHLAVYFDVRRTDSPIPAAFVTKVVVAP